MSDRGGFDHFGICLTCRMPAPEIVRYARLADEAGIGSVWVNESHYYRSALSALSAVAAVTRRVLLGAGVVSAFSRHPAFTAMEAATIDELSGGRFILGLGATPVWGEDSPLREGERPVAAMREATEIVRGLWARKIADYRGSAFTLLPSDHHSETGTSLNFRPVREGIPVYYGVKGPKLLRLAGAVADGVLLTNPTTPEYVRETRALIEAGAWEAGRDLSDFKTAAFVTLSVGDDREKARDAVREMLATYVDHVGSDHADILGLTESEVAAFREAMRAGGAAAAAKWVKDDLIDRLAVAGTAAECAERLSAYVEAGLDVPVAFHTLGPDRERAIRIIGEELIPAVCR
ncbi:MAG: LLM class flavin-dependent oxidoreductase [Nitrospinota bacterium]